MQVSSAKRTVTIDSLSVHDWPEIAGDVEWKPLCQTDSSALVDVLGKIASCASKDESRPVLAGVQFNLEDGVKSAQVVATDSYRLGVATLEVEPIGDAPHPSPIHPATVLKALANELKRFEGQVVLHLGSAGQQDNQRELIKIAFGFVSWIIRPIEGEFPNWKASVPSESAGSTFEYDSKEFATAVKGASELRSQKSTLVRLALGDCCTQGH